MEQNERAVLKSSELWQVEKFGLIVLTYGLRKTFQATLRTAALFKLQKFPEIHDRCRRDKIHAAIR